MTLRLLSTWFLLLALVATACSIVYVRHLNRSAFSELDIAQGDIQRLEVDWGKLQLEQATWAEPGFIESEASGRLKMFEPEIRQIVVIRE